MSITSLKLASAELMSHSKTNSDETKYPNGFAAMSFERIKSAILEDELCFQYQPEVDLATGEILGFEALVRWNHPEHGLLSPAAFLPAIEMHSLQSELGRWGIDTALQQLSSWSKQGIDTSVSVNISPSYLASDGFVTDLECAFVKNTNVSPSRLGLELLESSEIESMSIALNAMKKASDVGVWFAIDDFGTGYSSLSYLRELPSNLIKIDKSFVSGMCKDVADLKIVSAIVGLSKALGKRVIAEGVETQAHCDALLSVGCNLAQGYGIARPMSAARVTAWISKYSSSEVGATNRRLSTVDLKSSYSMATI